MRHLSRPYTVTGRYPDTILDEEYLLMQTYHHPEITPKEFYVRIRSPLTTRNIIWVWEGDRTEEVMHVPVQNIIFAWEGDWAEEALLAYQFRYGPTFAPFDPRTFWYATNTNCASIIAESFQVPIFQKPHSVLDEFKVSDYKASLQFITEYPNIAPLLKQVRRAIRGHFDNPDVSLEPKTDPETGNQEMWIYIHTDLPVPEAMKTLESLDTGHFLETWKKSDRKLCLDLLFV
jgi:hypothetical protein